MSSAKRTPPSWERHDIETVSALLTLYARNPPLTTGSLTKDQWRWTFMFSLLVAWMSCWTSNRVAAGFETPWRSYDVATNTPLCGSINSLWSSDAIWRHWSGQVWLSSGDGLVPSLVRSIDNHPITISQEMPMSSTHYNDVIMTTMASQITSLAVVYSTVYSDADQRKHQSSASLAFVWGIHRDRWIPRTNGQ